MTTTELAKGYYNAKSAKVDNTPKVAKHPPDPPRQPSICPNKHSQNSGKASASDRRAAKHPPEDNRCNPDEADETSEGRRKSGNSPRRVDDHHQRSFQDDASNERTTPPAPPLSDQKGQGFHMKSSPERREEGQGMPPSKR